MSNRKKERINSLNSDAKKKLDLLWNSKVKEYQFLPGKKSKKYPEKKDVFCAKTQCGIKVFGVVLNNYISSKNGEKLIVVAIYINSPIDTKSVFNFEDMLVQPMIVDDNYWKKGLFEDTGKKIDKDININYGFYRIFNDSFCDEYGNKLENEPVHLETYGISTIHGVSFKTMEELIIKGIV